jgi:hypothetical protein
MSVQVSYKKQFIFGIMLLILLFFIIEISSQIIYLIKSEENCFLINWNIYPEFDREFKKQICNDLNDLLFFNNYWYVDILPNQYLETITINSDGFRGDEIIKDESSDKIKIFVVGGSTVFGWASSSDNSTIPAYLQKNFDKNSNYNVEVINAGIPNAWSFTELNLVQQKILQFNPDIIIIYNGWNDVGKSTKSWLNYFNTNESQQNNSSINNNTIKRILANFKTTTLLRDLNEFVNIKLDQNENGRAHVEYKKELVDVWFNNLRTVCETGNTNNFDTIIILQPLVGTGERELMKHDKTWFKTNTHQEILNSYSLYEEALESLDDNCTLTLNYLDVFDDYDYPVYYDVGHTVDRGNEIIAEKIFESTLPIIKIDK